MKPHTSRGSKLLEPWLPALPYEQLDAGGGTEQLPDFEMRNGGVVHFRAPCWSCSARHSRPGLSTDDLAPAPGRMTVS